MSGSATVAVIGLGRMGGPMADHLVAAGHDVRVFDPEPSTMVTREAAGATATSSAADAAAGSDFVQLVVFDDAQTVDALTGDGGAFEQLAPGAIVSVHSTVTLETIELVAAAGARRDITVLDAGISGGESGALAATLLVMVGGPTEAVQRARPIMGAYASEVLHCGDLGAGMTVKLARNAAAYGMMAVVHEAMDLVDSAGVDVDHLRHALAVTEPMEVALAPFAMGGPSALPDDAPDEQRAFLTHTRDLAEKDLDQALHLARRVDTAVPTLTSTRQGIHRAVRL